LLLGVDEELLKLVTGNSVVVAALSGELMTCWVVTQERDFTLQLLVILSARCAANTVDAPFSSALASKRTRVSAWTE
jgi:hypothetical protein